MALHDNTKGNTKRWQARAALTLLWAALVVVGLLASGALFTSASAGDPQDSGNSGSSSTDNGAWQDARMLHAQRVNAGVGAEPANGLLGEGQDPQVSAYTVLEKGQIGPTPGSSKEPRGLDTPLDVTIPGSPISVVARPSGSYAVYRNNIQQFYGSYAEGVYLWVGSTGGSTSVWGPEQVPAGRNPNSYTQISHTLTGTGTSTNPWVARVCRLRNVLPM